MSLLRLFYGHLILTLSVLIGAETANVYYRYTWIQCISSSKNLSDMVFIESLYFNKYLFTQFNSNIGKYVGFSEYGIRNAEFRNNDTNLLLKKKAAVNKVCKNNAINHDKFIRNKAVKPKVKLTLVKPAGGRHPAVLMCSAYEFYPPHIRVYWLRNGEVITSDVTSTMEMADGDWYYQIHSELEYSPKSGERISCGIEHASSNKPIITEWDSSRPASERNKIAIGASGVVLGIIIPAICFIYYKKTAEAVL
uniref:H-2 class II histocompatibility antigen, E-S beta chain n=1 Tax=Danio rerio TaxID=7955 RepID=F1QVI4_DANRE|nr:H-2 class II histocompatibility antigen, E-S beta chain [Danio rerio]|eukprot:XP_005167291.1 H-2 class II histocompatibility antigen, E-S beta chain [Danio rerio]